MDLSSFDYIPCEGCEFNNMRCEMLCEGCKDWHTDSEEEASDYPPLISDDELPF